MTAKQLVEGHEKAWKQIYGWTAMAKRLWNARNFQPLAISANIGYRFYAHNLDKFYNCDWQLDPLLPDFLPDIGTRQDKIAGVSTTETKNKAICG